MVSVLSFFESGMPKVVASFPACSGFNRDDADTIPCAGVLWHIIDVKDVKWVLNYDFPNNVEDYVHRIGRTGRGGATGSSVTYFTMENSKQARDLMNVLTEANQEIPPELADMVRMGGGGGRGGFRGGRGGFGGGRGGGGGGGGGGRRW